RPPPGSPRARSEPRSAGRANAWWRHTARRGRTAMSHLDEGQLTSLLDGELTASAQREAEAHLAICAECRGLYDEIRAFSVEADALVTGIELPRQPAPLPALSPGVQPRGDGAQASRRPLPWRTLGWAATLVAALGLGYLVRG